MKYYIIFVFWEGSRSEYFFWVEDQSKRTISKNEIKPFDYIPTHYLIPLTIGTHNVKRC
jgi:hypothetical protein